MIGRTREARVNYAAALRLAVELAKLKGHDCADMLLRNAIIVADENEPPRPSKPSVAWTIPKVVLNSPSPQPRTGPQRSDL